MASSSAAHEQHHFPKPYGATAAPPPTPSTQPNPFATSDAAADVLSRLIHRLPPSLSLPNRRSSKPPATSTLPLVSLSDPNPNLPSTFQLGFFQLTDHSVPSQLAHSAESDSLALFDLPHDQKQLCFPKNWPLGYDGEDDDEEEDGTADSFCFDSDCSTESTELSLASLREFTREMERLGLEVVEALSCAVGFDNPVREDPTRVCSLMWVAEGHPGNKQVVSGKMYPYIVGLHYQIWPRKYSLLADSGLVSISPQVDSVLVTLGDIAQVWSNGNIKKVRGRPIPSSMGDGNKESCISMSLLVTLPMDGIVSPLLPRANFAGMVLDHDEAVNKDEDGEEDGSVDKKREKRLFNSFSFEDYAWRVYHERLPIKDPLDRYRI